MRRAALARRRFRRAALVVIVIAGGLSPWSPLREHRVEAGSTTRVQAGSEIVSATGDVTVTMSAASTAGNLLVAVVSNGGTSSSFPYSGPAGWVLATGTWQSGVGRAEIWYYPANPGGVTSAAFTSSTTSIGAVGQMSEWSGAATPSFLDATGTATVASATSLTVSTNASTTVAGDLGITAFRTGAAEGSFTVGAGWTHDFTDPARKVATDYRQNLATAVASEAETAPTAAAWLGVVAAFKPLQQPGPVRALSAVAGADKATISWTAPATGGAVSSYVVTALAAGLSPRNATAIPGTSTSVTLPGLTGATAYKFAVYGINTFGSGTTVTAAASVTPTGGTHPYASEVLGDTPSLYFRFDETAPTTALDSSGNASTGTEVGSPTQATAGTLMTDTDTALTLNGTTQYVYGSASYVDPTTFSIEAWFKTSTTTGGRLVGFGDTQVGNSVNADRAVYMANSGQLYFGVSAGALRTINSALSYNDSLAHHVVATLSSAGMFLYVDGSQVASDPTTATAQNYTGYWRVGEDNLAGWPSAPTSNFFNGIIDDVAVYPSALSLQRAQVHYCEGANANCLSITQPTSVTFPGQGLDGTDHTISAALSWDVVDSTEGVGWSVSATSTWFAAGTHHLGAGATRLLLAPAVSCDTGFTCTLPTTSVAYPYTLPAGAPNPTATKLFNAIAGTGRGHETLVTTATLAIPANAYAGIYSSTWTFTVASGP